MRLRLFVAVLLFAAAFVFAGNSTAKAQSQNPSENEQKEEQPVLVVEKGDTLTKLAKAHETTYVRLFNANEHIAHPDIIHPGDKVRVPAQDEKLPKRPLPSTAPAERSYSSSSSSNSSPRNYAQPAAASTYTGDAGVWDRLAQCEAGGNWNINTGNGYYGGLQFTPGSWRAAGGSGLPHQASKAEQIERGKILQSKQGWGAWPACSSKLGLR